MQHGRRTIRVSGLFVVGSLPAPDVRAGGCAFLEKVMSAKDSAVRDENRVSEDVVDRLRAAREKAVKEEYEDGASAGRKWARSTATPKELKRLERYVTSGDGNAGWWDVDCPNWCAPFGAADYLVFALRPRDKDDHDAPNQFWTEALGDDIHRIQDGDFLRGFGEGAITIWEQVKDRL
jgi:hypothetical protein